MNHQPYETWLFQEEPLTGEQKLELETHLQICPECQQLCDRWQAVAFLLSTASLATPPAGFGDRLKVSLERKKTLRHLRNTRFMLVGLIVGAALAFAVLAGVIFSSTTPANLLTGGARLVNDLVIVVNQAQRFLAINLFNPVPLAIWILFSLGVCALIVAWVLALWKVAFRNEVSQ